MKNNLISDYYKDFSSRNLWRMRNLYVEYKDNEFLLPLVAEISWSKNFKRRSIW